MRIGLIGAGGNMRLRHIPGFRAIEGVELVSVANRTRESSERAAREFGIAKAMSSPEELIADDGIDAVCIGTWPYRHREYTIRALEAGKHVLCEARMAMDAAEAEEMFAAHQEHPGLVAQLVPAPFDFRLGPTIQRLLGEGALGDVTEVLVTVLNGSGVDPAAPLHWRHQQRYSGRNIMMLGIYNEIVQRWLGRTARVAADGKVFVTRRPDPETGGEGVADVPDSFTVAAEMANGARATYSFSAMTPALPASSIVVHGTKASLAWLPAQARAPEQATLERPGGHSDDLQPDPGTDRGWRVEADFVASVRTGAPVRLTDFAAGLDYMRFTDACWRSWQRGTAVEVTSDE